MVQGSHWERQNFMCPPNCHSSSTQHDVPNYHLHLSRTRYCHWLHFKCTIHAWGCTMHYILSNILLVCIKKITTWKKKWKWNYNIECFVDVNFWTRFSLSCAFFTKSGVMCEGGGSTVVVFYHAVVSSWVMVGDDEHLFRIGYVRYLMAFVCMYFIGPLFIGLGVLRLFSCVMECLCTTSCMFAKNIMMGLTIHRCCLSVSIRVQAW